MTVVKTVYVKCPRCDLNFILKKDRMCAVCKQELADRSTNYTDDSGTMGMCPICKVNYITEDESVCETCIGESDLSEDELDALYGGVEMGKDDDELTDDDEELEILSMEIEEENLDEPEEEDELKDALNELDELDLDE